MDEPTAIWHSFLPHDVAAELARDPSADPLAAERRYEAVALFADVSGFTAISEALAQSGRRGTEELTSILNSYFGPMIELIESYGGIIGKFGGDAMTVLFPYRAATRRAVARRALQCALDMQAAMGRYAAIETSAGTYALTMKAGLALGTALCATAGDPAVRAEYLIAGGLLDRSADAEHHATRGEVVAHADVVAAAGDARVAEPRGDYALVGGLARRPRRAPLPQLPPPGPALVDVFARFLHPSLAERIRAGRSGFLNEHRRVTVLFVSFSGFDYDGDPGVVGPLQAYLADVVRAVQRYDGYLNKVDMGDKGSKYVVLFGAPVAHENDDERAVRCALDLRDLGAGARVGVNTGVVYCGLVGSPARQEYTVMGDPVNLAARLMQAARPGQVLASEATRRGAAAFDWEELEPIAVKGKRDPVAVAVALRARAAAPALSEPHYALPMVGREAELRRAAGLLARAAGGRGQLIGVCAEAGLGKSRLASAVAGEAAAGGFEVLAGACQSYGTRTSYLVWQGVWRSFFGVDPDSPAAEVLASVRRQLARLDPRLAPRAPLLGPALGLPLPDTELTRALDPQLRADLLKSLLLECLRRSLAGGRRLLIVLEDCHWIDPLSQELVEFLGRNVAGLPAVLLLVYRPPSDGRGPGAWAARAPFFTELRLEELAGPEAEQLARLKLAQHWGEGLDPPAQLLAQIAERAAGNPFYVEELVNYLHDRGVDPRDPEALARVALPDSLQSLILSRVDQLGEDEKVTLKVASVIGRVFSAHWIWGAYPPIGEPESVLAQLQTLSRLDLTPLDKPEPELEYLFKHITTQEVAYESLAFATRTMLHGQVAAYIERTYAESLARHLDALAFHYGRSADQEKQRVYFRLAADAARDAYASEAALSYYGRLIELLPEPERAPVLAEVGEVRQLTGDWSAAEADLARAHALAEAAGDEPTRARCLVALGALLASRRSPEEGLGWLERGRAAFERLGDRRGAGRALEHMGLIYFEQGDTDRALACAERRLALARGEDDRRGVSAALDQLGIVSFQRGAYDVALAHLAESLAIARAEGDQPRAIIAGNDMAGVYWQTGDYARALRSLGEALGVAGEIGYAQTVGYMYGNAGLIYQGAGDELRAVRCYLRALSTAGDLGDRPSSAQHLTNLAAALGALGQADLAGRLFARAEGLARQLGILYSLCELLAGRAELLAAGGAHADALALAREAAALAAQVDRREVRARAELLAVRSRVALGELGPPAALAELAALAEGWEPAERAAALHAALLVDPQQPALRAEAAAAYAALSESVPSAENRRRYAELAGAEIPPPPPLPDLPGVAGGEALGALLPEVERVVGQLEAL